MASLTASLFRINTIKHHFSKLVRQTAFITIFAAGSTIPVLSASGQSASKSTIDETLLERAFLFDEGIKVPRDAKAAAALYQTAADNGDPFAHLRLGYLAETGDGITQSYVVARAHYQAAADAGLNEARLQLAICHLEGWGGPVDRQAFVREVRAAAQKGDSAAQKILATVYFLGVVVPADQEEGMKWLERAAKQDSPSAQVELGQRSETTRVKALMPQLDAARTWYRLSAENEYETAMRAMARTFLTGPRTGRNWQLGQRWLELADECGDAEAPYILALCEILHVDSPNPDIDRATTRLKSASKRGNFRAIEVLDLQTADWSLRDAMKYVLMTPQEERYVKRAIKAPMDAPTRAPQIYKIVRPIYPQTLFITDTSGEVMVDFFVDTNGNVTDAQALKSSHPLFTEKALDAVRQWRFHPGRKDGVDVSTHMQVPVIFDMDSEKMVGIDGLLSYAQSRAQQLGANVAADAINLHPAALKERLPFIILPGGKPLPPKSRVILLLVIDSRGHPLRGHVLYAAPEEAGQAVLNASLGSEFRPRVLHGAPMTSNVIFDYTPDVARWLK